MVSKASPVGANEFIEQQLDTRIAALEAHFTADAIAFSGPLIGGTDDLFRSAIEEKQKSGIKDRAVIVLTTLGGYIEIVHRIVATLRHHYKLVDFVVPNYAFSAGTVLVMSGDSIHMDYYSRLGPIDPQVETESGRTVSALGYLQRYEELLAKASDPHAKISNAEVQILLSFDQGELYDHQQARELSISLLKEWLVRYKFKNWKKTATRGKTVTTQMKKARAAAIARTLNDTARWHSHGYGISREVLERDLKLMIDDFGTNATLSDAVRNYHALMSDYMGKMGITGAIHAVGHFRPFMLR